VHLTGHAQVTNDHDRQEARCDAFAAFGCLGWRERWLAALVDAFGPCLLDACAPALADDGAFEWTRIVSPSRT
jgi:hypothetical protein